MKKAETLLMILSGMSDSHVNFSKYEIVIYLGEEDQLFAAEVPELSGCMADGATYAEALHHAEAAIRLWIEVAIELGREIPKAKAKLLFV